MFHNIHSFRHSKILCQKNLTIDKIFLQFTRSPKKRVSYNGSLPQPSKLVTRVRFPPRAPSSESVRLIPSRFAVLHWLHRSSSSKAKHIHFVHEFCLGKSQGNHPAPVCPKRCGAGRNYKITGGGCLTLGCRYLV